MISRSSTMSSSIASPALARQIEAMAGYGLSAADIACVLETDEAGMRQLYSQELASGHIKANLRVAESLYRKATGDHRQSVTAAIFWLKTQARWRETSLHEIGGAGSTPIVVVTGVERGPGSYIAP